MKIQRKRTWTALLLAVSILFTLPVWVTGSARAVDLGGPCSLTMVAAENPDDATAATDIASANVVVDLYKVANAIEVPGYDTYDYELVTPFTGLAANLELAREADPEEGAPTVTWEQLANEAANIALAASDPQPVGDPTPMGDPATVASGLYLVVPHSAGMTDYVKDEGGSIVTIAQSPEYEYTFAPSLVSLPSTNAELSTTGMNTADGEWVNNVRGTLKFSREQRFGDLTITKTLDGYQPNTGAMFVFEVRAEKDDETVYSNVVSLDFTGDGSQSVTLTGVIPAESHVTVREVYSGSAYQLTSEAEQTAEIRAGETAEVSFSNTYTGGLNDGGGILNSFEYNGEAWDWTATPPQEQ